jgi:hypothetical protein
MIFARMVHDLAECLRGWIGYFGRCETPEVLDKLERWLGRRLRSMVWKGWKRGTTRCSPPEPPDADPHVRSCGREECVTTPPCRSAGQPPSRNPAKRLSGFERHARASRGRSMLRPYKGYAESSLSGNDGFLKLACIRRFCG